MSTRDSNNNTVETITPGVDSENTDTQTELSKEETGFMGRGMNYIKNTLEPSQTQQQEVDDPAKRKTLGQAATLTTISLAGCTDNSSPGTTPTPEPSPEPSNNNSTQTTEEEPEVENEGLNLGFDENDMWQKETQFYEQNADFDTGGDTAYQIAKNAFDENADLTDYNDFQDVFINTLNTTIGTLAENISTDSSSLTRAGSAAVNLVIQEELKENEAYEDFNAKIINGGVPGHGSFYIVSTHHPAQTADSNTDNIGKIQDKPLQGRNNPVRDPMAAPYGKEFEELSREEQIDLHAFPTRVYSTGGNKRSKIAFGDAFIDELQDLIYTSDGANLLMNEVRDAVATTRFMLEEGYFENEGYEAVRIDTEPSNLIAIDDYQQFDDYAEDLLDNHVTPYRSVKKLEEEVF